MPNPLQLKIVDFSLVQPRQVAYLSLISPLLILPYPLSGHSKLSNGKRLPPGACCLSRNLTRKWKSRKTTTRKIRCGKQRKKCCKNYQRKFVESTRATTALIRQSSRDRRKREKRAQANRSEPNLNPLPPPPPCLTLLRASETCKWTLGAVD